MTHTGREDGVPYVILEGTTTFIEEMEGLHHVDDDEEDYKSIGSGGCVRTSEDLVPLRKNKFVP